MRIAVDANVDARGDAGLRPFLAGTIRAAAQCGAEPVFYGTVDGLRAGLRALGLRASAARAEGAPAQGERWTRDDGISAAVVHAPSSFISGEDPQAACREKPEASLMRAAAAVASKQAAALVSPAAAGAVCAAALWHLKRLRGVLRPALAVSMPTRRGTSLIVDAGLNYDCKPWHLLQFALMGAIYARAALGREKPTVALLAPSGESAGVSELIGESLPLLKYTGVDFRGVISGREAADGAADVIVCDGAAGDVTVNLFDGLSTACFEMLESAMEANVFRRFGRLFLQGTVQGIKARLDASRSGSAPVIGLGGSIVVCRRPDREDCAEQSIRMAADLVKSDVHERIRERLEDIKSDMEFTRAID